MYAMSPVEAAFPRRYVQFIMWPCAVLRQDPHFEQVMEYRIGVVRRAKHRHSRHNSMLMSISLVQFVNGREIGRG